MAKYFTYKERSFSVGDTVRVHFNVKDGEKTRIQLFEGIIIGVANRLAGKVFNVRKVAAGGIGVEKITPLNSPIISDIEMVTKGDVRRAKLNYLRNRVGKSASKVKKQIELKTVITP